MKTMLTDGAYIDENGRIWTPIPKISKSPRNIQMIDDYPVNRPYHRDETRGFMPSFKPNRDSIPLENLGRAPVSVVAFEVSHYDLGMCPQA